MMLQRERIERDKNLRAAESSSTIDWTSKVPLPAGPRRCDGLAFFGLVKEVVVVGRLRERGGGDRGRVGCLVYELAKSRMSAERHTR